MFAFPTPSAQYSGDPACEGLRMTAKEFLALGETHHAFAATAATSRTPGTAILRPRSNRIFRTVRQAAWTSVGTTLRIWPRPTRMKWSTAKPPHPIAVVFSTPSTPIRRMQPLWAGTARPRSTPESASAPPAAAGARTEGTARAAPCRRDTRRGTIPAEARAARCNPHPTRSCRR